MVSVSFPYCYFRDIIPQQDCRPGGPVSDPKKSFGLVCKTRPLCLTLLLLGPFLLFETCLDSTLVCRHTAVHQDGPTVPPRPSKEETWSSYYPPAKHSPAGVSGLCQGGRRMNRFTSGRMSRETRTCTLRFPTLTLKLRLSQSSEWE